LPRIAVYFGFCAASASFGLLPQIPGAWVQGDPVSHP
jgi:hypothetical protein